MQNLGNIYSHRHKCGDYPPQFIRFKIPQITQFDLNNSKSFGILSGISDLCWKTSDEKRNNSWTRDVLWCDNRGNDSRVEAGIKSGNRVLVVWQNMMGEIRQVAQQDWHHRQYLLRLVLDARIPQILPGWGVALLHHVETTRVAALTSSRLLALGKAQTSLALHSLLQRCSVAVPK